MTFKSKKGHTQTHRRPRYRLDSCEACTSTFIYDWKGYFSSPKCPDWIRGPTQSPGRFTRNKVAGREAKPLMSLVTRLKMSGGVTRTSFMPPWREHGILYHFTNCSFNEKIVPYTSKAVISTRMAYNTWLILPNQSFTLYALHKLKHFFKDSLIDW